MHLASSPRRAFTVVELLVITGIVLVLATLTLGASRHMIAKGKMVREVQAGRNLITAYQLHAAENDGRYLPGMDFTVTKVWFEPYGRDITTMHTANRYPYRLAPYFSYQLNGTILVNDSVKQINKVAAPGSSMHDYVVSAFPAFGINYYFVGGCIAGTPAAATLVYPDECVSRAAQATHSLLVFASAGTTDGSTRMEGFNILTPPSLYSTTWSGAAWTKNEDPGIHGNVDARHDGRAVCVYLDGSVKLQGIEDLRDMRLWNRNAAEQNNPGYTIPL